jgi:WD40 repeat protein
MKHLSPDIAWHGEKQRILSIDFHPFSDEFATAGSQERIFTEEKDSDLFSGCVKLWELDFNNLSNPLCKYGLSEMISNVNVVKYSPDGRFLAVANDFKEIIVYTESLANRSFSSQ